MYHSFVTLVHKTYTPMQRFAYFWLQNLIFGFRRLQEGSGGSRWVQIQIQTQIQIQIE